MPGYQELIRQEAAVLLPDDKDVEVRGEFGSRATSQFGEVTFEVDLDSGRVQIKDPTDKSGAPGMLKLGLKFSQPHEYATTGIKPVHDTLRLGFL